MGRRDRRDIAIVALLLLVAALLLYSGFATLPACSGCNAKVDFVFSPGAEGEIVSFIRSAEKTIDIEMYVFTSDAIVREIAEAERRGARVRVILEPRVQDERKDRIAAILQDVGAEVKWASFAYKLTHSKFIIVDGKKAVIGSINFSKSALTANREAAVLVEGEKIKELARIFEEDWNEANSE
ncbi:MAG: phospholipase D-like domain-containing protein [Candidatus Anstonellaceae archaeon]